MVKVILISHGKLSEGMLSSVRMITGIDSNVKYYGLYPGNHPNEIIKEIEEEVENNQQNTYIIAADIFGGSVCNAAMELVRFKNVKLISGMNLSLVIELVLSGDDVSDEELNEKINNAKDGMKLFSNSSESITSNNDNDFF